ncbi:MAG: hypothetical protein AABX03_02425 [Nanoarchaeota archaeon]
MGGSPREAIVVDSKNSQPISNLFNIARKKASINGTVKRSEVLRAVFGIVYEQIPPTDNSEILVERLIGTYLAWDDRKMNLDRFIENRVGVCRHYALACGVLLELFKKNGNIFGTPSIDRSTTFEGAHAWCRYTGSCGEVRILDVMQNFFGSIQEAESEGRWDYRRPED